MIRRLAVASPLRTLSEALLLAAALTLLLVGSAALEPDIRLQTLSQGVMFVSILTALWAALRCRPLEGAWRRRVLLNVAYAIVMALGFAAVSGGMVYLVSLSASPGAAMMADVLTELQTLAALLGYVPLVLVFRVAAWLWRKWDDLRRQRMVWSLTHAILLVVLSAAALLMILLFATFFSPVLTTLPAVPASGPLGRTLEVVISRIFPLAGVLLAMTLAGLAFVSPFATLFAYLVARRTTRRLRDLSETAAALTAGDTTARSPVDGDDEVARLQADFNAMAAALEGSIDDLEAERDTVTGVLENRRTLVANVSHDLRTPAATIRATVDSLLDGAGEDDLTPELHHDLSVIQAEVGRLQRLIDDLFLLSRAEIGRLTLRPESIDAGPFITGIVDAIAPLAWQMGRVEVVGIPPPDSLALRADPERLAQILHNLIHNAIRHTPPGGIVAVEARCDGDGRIALSVRDTGSGIPAEALPHVWDRFYRVADTEGGAGLGLAIVKELAEMMDGTVTAESTPGGGSCFGVSLPAA
jgi:signal transduction histidine kinase